MPVLQAGEVLVQVHAVGVNPPDSYLRDGYQQLPPEWRPEVRFPVILGTDLSGVVVARADARPGGGGRRRSVCYGAFSRRGGRGQPRLRRVR